MPIAADQRHPNALKPKKPRKPPGLAGLSLANLAPENSFVLSDTGTFQKVRVTVTLTVGLHASDSSALPLTLGALGLNSG